MSAFTSGAPRSASSYIFGRAGKGLDNADWAVSQRAAKAGQAGERKTASVLDPLAGPNAVVLHDLMIPHDKYTANIDHVVVTGRTIYLIDSKAWKPGFLWTFGGKTRRGFEPFSSADSRTMSLARESVLAYLMAHSINGMDVQCHVVVWPSRKEGRVSVWAARMPGARLMGSDALPGFAKKIMSGHKPADASTVAALRDLLTDSGNGKPGQAARRYMRR